MSDQPTAMVLHGFTACGYRLSNPNMHISLLSLVVIPELRLSDKRLIDVSRFEIIPVLEKVDAAPVGAP